MKARAGEIKLKAIPKGRFEAAWGGKGASKADANWMLGFLFLSKNETAKTFAEFERRGYDLTSLRVSIRRKK